MQKGSAFPRLGIQTQNWMMQQFRGNDYTSSLFNHTWFAVDFPVNESLDSRFRHSDEPRFE